MENTENASLEILPKLKAAVLLSPGQFEAVRHIFGRRVSQETFMKRRKFTRRGLARIDLLHVETARALGMDRWMSSLSSAVCSLQHALAARVEARSANTKGIFARKS